MIVSFDGFVPVLALFPVAAVVAAISVLLRSRPVWTGSSIHDPLIDALLVYSALSIAYIVLAPQPAIPERVRLPVGVDFSMALQADSGDSMPWIQLVGNVLLLLPLAAMVPLRVPWFDNVGRIAVGGLTLSCTIEVTQFLAVTGRIASTDDIVLNTLGAALGGLLVRPPWRSAAAQVPDAAEPVGRQHGNAVQGESVWRLIEKVDAEREREARSENRRRARSHFTTAPPPTTPPRSPSPNASTAR